MEDDNFLLKGGYTAAGKGVITYCLFSGTNKADCDVCKDNPRKKCKQCACHECGDKKDPNKTIMCDECDSAWHLYCLNPPLVELPEEDEW